MNIFKRAWQSVKNVFALGQLALGFPSQVGQNVIEEGYSNYQKYLIAVNTGKIKPSRVTGVAKAKRKSKKNKNKRRAKR